MSALAGEPRQFLDAHNPAYIPSDIDKPIGHWVRLSRVGQFGRTQLPFFAVPE